MSFFIENNRQFVLEPREGMGLRRCQLGAVWALKSHFTAFRNEAAALISMPTGSGKTALMMAACFELQLRKVLIVVPSKILRRQICEQFRSLQVLKDIGCLAPDLPPVRVFEVEKRQTSQRSWAAILAEHDVIVAHPNSISPYYKNLSPLPADLIDAVFMDEAHHEPAPTWKALDEYYRDRKRVFFTATPFRRDRKRMKARLAYHYPLERALDEHVLRPVQFRGVRAGLYELSTERALIATAGEVFREERQSSHNAAILIRTDRIDAASDLSRRYNAAGIRVDVIHSKRSPNVNARIVQEVREGQLDGLVCVGIASEGLDIPNLKIAVLHATPRSVPYTIQFLGRISRQPREQEGPATLIANRDEVRGEVSRLYKSDEAWRRLIPEIVDRQMSGARLYSSAKMRDSNFQMPELNVFFSALIYETAEDFAFAEDFGQDALPPFEIVHVEQANDESPLIVITSYSKPLDWASRNLYVDDVPDLHIFYHHGESRLLFELSTSELALHSFKERLIRSKLRRIPHGRLYRTLSGFDQSDYIMVGMKNAVLHGAAQPSYKTLIGSSVQASVRASEGRVFSPGHALLRLDDQHTWGLATKRGRVWAMKRGNVEAFKAWCDELASLIENGPVIASLPGLSFLASSTPVHQIDELPIAIIPDDLFFRAYTTIIHMAGHEPARNAIPVIEPKFLDRKNTVLHCQLQIEDCSCPLCMDFHAEHLWSIGRADIRVRADRHENDVVEGTLEKILNDYPPSLVMPDGCVIEGRNRIMPNKSVERLPPEIWRQRDWTNCRIMAERYEEHPPPDGLPVINQTVELIRPEFDGRHDILILDDGSHEVADLIWFRGGARKIYYIHCKASGAPNPGCRKGDCDVLFAQAMRSIHWVSVPSLIERLAERLRGNSRIILGDEHLFEAIRTNFRINDWRYQIVLVQPGFSISQAADKDRPNNNVYELAIPMYERILGSMAGMEIWGA